METGYQFESIASQAEERKVSNPHRRSFLLPSWEDRKWEAQFPTSMIFEYSSCLCTPVLEIQWQSYPLWLLSGSQGQRYHEELVFQWIRN